MKQKINASYYFTRTLLIVCRVNMRAIEIFSWPVNTGALSTLPMLEQCFFSMGHVEAPVHGCSWRTPVVWTEFLPRCMECSRGIAMGILSVCLSNACIVTKQRKICLDFYIIRRNIYLSFLRRRMVGGGDPFYLKFWVNRPALERNRRF